MRASMSDRGQRLPVISRPLYRDQKEGAAVGKLLAVLAATVQQPLHLHILPPFPSALHSPLGSVCFPLARTPGL